MDMYREDRRNMWVTGPGDGEGRAVESKEGRQMFWHTIELQFREDFGTRIYCKKILDRRLNCYRHVGRRDEEQILRKVVRTDIPGKRKSGRGYEQGHRRRKISSYTGDPT